MKLKYTILYVENVLETLAFYQKAFGEQLAALGKNPVAPTPGRPSFEIAFETDDVPVAFERAVAAGASAVMKPDQMPWGQVISYVTDKNGFLVEICSPVETD
jgi:uncharacterized glyoxalase superfamily protein PhnB